MNPQLLRRWANDTLSPPEKRQVYRWMVTCTDPDLPLLLHGMLRERREREADQRLSAQKGLWSSLVDHWHTLLDAGEAAWTTPGTAPVLATVDQAQEQPLASIEEPTDGKFTLALHTPPALQVTALISTDTPSVHLLCEGLPGGDHNLPLPAVGPRPTVWVFVGAALPRAARPEETLKELLQAEGVTVQALRWQG